MTSPRSSIQNASAAKRSLHRVYTVSIALLSLLALPAFTISPARAAQSPSPAPTPAAQATPKKPGKNAAKPKKTKAQDMAKRVRDACSPNMLIRIQAARRVGKGGGVAADAVLAFTKDKGTNAMSAELVSALGAIDSAKLRESMHAWVQDASFAWRPQALLALAEQPRPEDAALFTKYEKNGSWLMRRSALSGIARLGQKGGRARLERGLSDPDWRVAVRAAALLLDPQTGTRKRKRPVRLAKGEAPPKAALPPNGKRALPVLVRGLDAEDVFFGDDFGAMARKEAFEALRAWCSQRFGYQARAPRAARKAAIARFRQLVESVTKDTIEAAPAPPLRAWRFGFERRSCREGDLVLRLDAQGRLWRGAFTLEQVEISPDARKELRRLARAVPAKRKRSYGKIRCDLSRFTGLGAAGNISLRAAPDAVPDFLTELQKQMLSLGGADKK